MIRNQNRPIELRKKVLFSIWILAKQESYLAVGDRFGLAKSTGHNVLKDIVTVLTQLMPNLIIWPNKETREASSIVNNIINNIFSILVLFFKY